MSGYNPSFLAGEIITVNADGSFGVQVKGRTKLDGTAALYSGIGASDQRQYVAGDAVSLGFIQGDRNKVIIVGAATFRSTGV